MVQQEIIAGVHHPTTHVAQASSAMVVRFYGLLALGVGMSLLVIASLLPPAEAGIGTHRQLGLPTCSWVAAADLPCPTCGMTTSFSHAVRGEFMASFHAQPMGLALSLIATMAVVGGLWVVCTGVPLGRLVGAMWNRWWTWGVIGAFVLAWLYKIATYRGVL